MNHFFIAIVILSGNVGVAAEVKATIVPKNYKDSLGTRFPRNVFSFKKISYDKSFGFQSKANFALF